MNNIADINLLNNSRSEQKIEEESRAYDFFPMGLLILDEKGVIKTANPAAVRMLGVEKSHLIHTDFINFIHTEDQKNFRLDKNSFSNLSDQSFDIRLKKSQDLFWTRVDVVMDERDCFYTRQIKLILHDITGLKQVEAENTKLKLQLQQTQKMEAIGEHSSGIVHDLNNILHPIIGSLEILIQGRDYDRKLQKALENILAGANRASSLVRQILNFSRQADFEITPVKIQPIVREVLKLSRSTLPATIKIIQTIDNECGPVMADPTHIYQIAMNLITNAFQAIGFDGGIIDITLKEVEVSTDMAGKLTLNPGTYTCLSVADTGVGIDFSIINKIFEPYFTTKEKETGTGLGLSVISGIVKKYGGDICLSSEPGKGSLFQVYIPRVPVSFDPPLPINDKQKDLHGCESILFVDDEPFIVGVQQETLERYGYSVTPFVSTLDALNEFEDRPGTFDMVICDMAMPGMTGLALANKIKQINPDIPVIIYTGFSEHINKDNYHDRGIDGFLMKPVKKEESLRLIRHLLDNR